MDINFPLILVLLVAVSGAIWLLDIFLWAKPRRERVEQALQQLSQTSLKETDEAYQTALSVAAKEPVPVEYSKSFFPVLAFVLVLRSFLVEPFQIPSASMVPTLEVGDFILVNKYTYGIRLPVTNTKIFSVNEPERGDVMVFFPPHKPDTYYIKRVVGLPGDEIIIDKGALYINGKKMPQSFVASLPVSNPQINVLEEDLDGVEHIVHQNIHLGRYTQSGRWKVPAGHYFMMGDNRDNSSDSREWGPVSEEAIVGKAFAIWMHWETFFSVPSFHRVGTIQ
ncbi:signal peptidase I [Simiduia agarivorans]|uniref:Signal peptidase I n=1 Tax=Simiduia agarivorans (strain DSM 21679 / JCM 13881 / BCRC 17597 / SA1) TaxID=1117647 RepID=K4KIS9_SIMAS|nr:signal peptidase I [Simiduia agarivorans]AFU97878.1 signal peptidase I [Simiduia agarivorans SA1 = DSM 21679]